VGRRYRFILTLHDLIYYSSRTPPRNFSWAVRLGWRVYHLSYLPVRMLLARADAVVTGSYSSRDEIAAARLTSRPITVVRSAVDDGGPRAALRGRPESRELVYMGSFMPYKNVEAIARALRHLPGYRLNLLSRVQPRERSRLERIAPPGSLVFHDGVSDEEYVRILGTATALVSASRQEGFGIPLVEAMAAGTPVVVSDIPVFHEIGGEAAEYFAPDDDRALAEAVLRLDSPGEWERRSRLSVAAAAEFTWDRSAGILYELALSLVGQGPAREPAPESTPRSRPVGTTADALSGAAEPVS